MVRKRFIPTLLLADNGLVKTKKFNGARYIGDPLNTVRIFNEKCADEIILLDIEASKKGLSPNFELISEIVSECFMPVSYGGGVSSVEDAKRLIRSGVEKVVVNTSCLRSYDAIREISRVFGSQALIGAVDVSKSMLGKYKIKSHVGMDLKSITLEAHLDNLVESGVGEIFLNDVERDGVMKGYDISLVRKISSQVPVPVIACGGAGSIDDLNQVISEGGASAAAGGSVFVFHGRLKAVLISYPSDYNRT